FPQDVTISLLIMLPCKKFTNSLELLECQVKKLAINEYGLSGKFIFTKTMSKNFFVRFFIDTTTFSKKKLVRFIDIKMNGCDALRTKFDVPLVQQIVLEIRRTSNIPFQCPLEANIPYTFENLTISDKFLNKFLPNLNFVQEIDFYEKDTIIGSIKTIGSILAKK
ncbi:uncharacterized protein LOC119614629, partial [Lucilia sericata]|uniref:uncharacterized protein LOC119614629 n=1 Tax=Lucilia sericata TaxID=13632 RepID=UPI0018A82D47